MERNWKSEAYEILGLLVAKRETANLEILGGGALGVTLTLSEKFSALFTPDYGVTLQITENGYTYPLEDAGAFEFTTDEEGQPNPAIWEQAFNGLTWAKMAWADAVLDESGETYASLN